MKLILFEITSLFVMISINCRSQNSPETETYFEGVINYSYDITDSGGKKVPFAFTGDEELHDKYRLIYKYAINERFSNLSHKVVYLDSKSHSAYEIDEDNKSIERIDNSEPEEISPIEFKKIGEEIVLGQTCDVYFIKYFKKMNYVSRYTDAVKPDTISCQYFISKNLKIFNPEILARLQGNHNTKLIDGRFSGIALKVVSKNSKGIMTVIVATKIEKRSVTDLIKLPDYAFKE